MYLLDAPVAVLAEVEAVTVTVVPKCLIVQQILVTLVKTPGLFQVGEAHQRLRSQSGFCYFQTMATSVDKGLQQLEWFFVEFCGP